MACSLLRHRNGCDNGTEAGGEVIVELKSQLKTLPIKKRINTELFIDREMMLFIQSDQEISDLLEEGRILAGIKVRE